MSGLSFAQRITVALFELGNTLWLITNLVSHSSWRGRSVLHLASIIYRQEEFLYPRLSKMRNYKIASGHPAGTAAVRIAGPKSRSEPSSLTSRWASAPPLGVALVVASPVAHRARNLSSKGSHYAQISDGDNWIPYVQTCMGLALTRRVRILKSEALFFKKKNIKTGKLKLRLSCT
eukprot:SAG31_NODE_1572_length_7850_cov_28.848794_1_plen_176_part_00